MVRVTQLSDLHFAEPGHRSHGGLGYDTDATWDLVHEHAFGDRSAWPDLVVVTGDITDAGHPDQYRRAAEHLGRVPVAVNVVPGNHDRHVPFEAHLPRPGLTASRTLRVDNWLFLFADSNFSGRDLDGDGRLRDRDDRIHHNGRLGAAEVAWLSDTIEATDADHAFIWVHHPPLAPGSFAVADYDAEVAELLAAHPRLRGVGAGHTHTDMQAELEGRPVFTCPALTVNVDFVDVALLPPGYRTYEFAADGTITSTCHLMDDPRWPRQKLPAAVGRWLMGEITSDELKAELGL